jgi:hypothetical protein
MDLSAVSRGSKRPPDNELYDHGCDLVEAAAAIRRLAGDPEAARAVPAVLGCLEAALHEMSIACTALEATTNGAIRARPVIAWNSRPTGSAERTRRGFGNLRRALFDAEDAAGAARALAARSLDA